MMQTIKLSPLERFFRKIVQRYDHERYWRFRKVVIDPSKGSPLGDLLRLYYIKRADAFHNASMGTHRNCGAEFSTPPNLPHGLNGIVVSHNAKIGRNCTIFHQVTIGSNTLPDSRGQCFDRRRCKADRRHPDRKQCKDRSRLYRCGGYSGRCHGGL